MKPLRNIAFIIGVFLPFSGVAQKDSTLRAVKTVSGNISPKSIVAANNGYVYAQNMMYRHTVTVYDKNGTLLQTIYDTVHPAHFGYADSAEVLKGSPVEATLNSDGSSIWISNYSMNGKGYRNPGCDACIGRNKYDKSYIYRINTATYEKTACIKSGAVPKYLQVSPNDKFVAVSNWSEGTVSIFSTTTNQLVKEVYVGAYPRGITWASTSNKLYVAVMGSTFVAEISAEDFSVTRKIEAGIHPRHICGPIGDSLLLVSLNGEGSVAVISLETEKVKKIFTGTMPRSMALSADGEFAYVVNYGDNTFSKISISKRKKIENCTTLKNPIGITVHPVTGEIWVACYSGFIQIFSDTDYNPNRISKKTQIAEVEFGIPTANIANAFTGLLNMFGDNTVTVQRNSVEQLKKVNTTTASSRATEVIPADHGYYLVAGAFKSKDNALRLKQKLAVYTYPTQLLPREEKGLTYVAIGPFKTKEDATITVEETSKKTGETCWVYYY